MRKNTQYKIVFVVQDKKPKLGSESMAKLLEAVDEWIPTPMRDLDPHTNERPG